MTTPPTTALEPMSKAYDPEATEPAMWSKWMDSGAFHADPNRVLNGDAQPYTILIPPPNVTAALHLGHALNNSIQDILIRAHRMKGFETLWMPGTDHAGIATQTMVDKKLKEEGKPGIADYKKRELAGEPGREEFLKLVYDFKDQYQTRITEQLMAMGCSCDWERQRFTMDDICARAVREAFFRLFKDGLIYRGKRLVNWDPVTQTALADDEVENEEVAGHFYYLRYPLVHQIEPGNHEPVTWSELVRRGYPDAENHPEDEQAWITVATTRPETYMGDTGVAVNPKDPRAKAIKGFFCELPIVGRVIPIIEDDYVVLPVKYGGQEGDTKAEMSTGFLKVTPAHDPNDWMIGQRHNLQPINIMAPDASISDQHGWEREANKEGGHVFIGKSREDARALVIEEFKARSVAEGSSGSLLERMVPYSHSVGHSYRSHAAIEPYLSDQWYCKVTDDKLRGNAQRALNPDQRTQASLQAWPKSTPNEPRPLGSDLKTTYLITYTTYGTWLHGDEHGSADRDHNMPGTPYLSPDAERESREEHNLKHPPVTLDETERKIVLDSIVEVCQHRDWTLHACNIRSNHLHVVVSSDSTPERVMNDFKSYATRHLKGNDDTKQAATVREQTWTRHGSTRYLNDELSFNGAMRYVLEEQGKDLGATFERGRSLPDGRGSSESTDGTMSFFPARYAKTYETWHDNLRDWCISRQLWWGHRIPVWSKISATPIEPNNYKWRDWSGDSFDMDNDSQQDALKPEYQGIYVEHQQQNTDGTWTTRICVKPGHEDFENELLASDYTQDPDVLDTWFSSALWPLSTMGWPDASAAKNSSGIEDFESMLTAFNPSSVLTTAREIITLWVSRMTMFNRYFLSDESERAATVRECSSESSEKTACSHARLVGPAPFKDVFIHAMIQDGQGRKMSKSLGNGVDPLDIIHSHGADAMRFTLCQMTTQTQDVRMPVEFDKATGKNTSPKFDIGRNLCNKLWNASKFAMMMLDPPNPPMGSPAPMDGPPIDPQELSLVDRWMLSRVVHATGAINTALRNYMFKDYADAIYDLLWRDFCDWYLESIKPTVADDANQAAVLRLVLDSILRLMHPVTPFITESIHERLSTIPMREITGFAFDQTRTNDTLCQSGWPSPDQALRDEVAEEAFDRIRALITLIREIRASNKVHAKRAIVLHVSGSLADDITRWSPLVETLGNIKEITSNEAPEASAAFVFEGSEYRLSDLADAVDASVEKERLTKELADLEKAIGGLKGRLSNPGYTDKAPEHLVNQTRAELEQKIQDRDSMKSSLDKLG